MRGLEDLEVGKSVELINGKPSKRRTIGTKGPNKIKILAVSSHPEDNNSLVNMWVEVDPESKRFYEEQRIKEELRTRENQVNKQAMFLEHKEKLAALDAREEELREKEKAMREAEAKIMANKTEVEASDEEGKKKGFFK